MSFTLIQQATPRLHRSELAVPGSNPSLFEKAAKAPSRHHLSRPGRRRRPRRQGAGAQEHHPGPQRSRLGHQDHDDPHQRPRHPLRLSRRGGCGGELPAPRHDPDPQDRRAAGRLRHRHAGHPDRAVQEAREEDRLRGADRDGARHGQCRGDRAGLEAPRGDELRRRRLRGLDPRPHRRHRRPAPGLRRAHRQGRRRQARLITGTTPGTMRCRA